MCSMIGSRRSGGREKDSFEGTASGDIGDLGDSVGGDVDGVDDILETATVIVLWGGMTPTRRGLGRLLIIEPE